MLNKTIVITGTHLTPALALIEKLKSEGMRVVYLGRKTSMAGNQQLSAEQQLLNQKEIKVKALLAPKFSRHQPLRSAISLLGLPLSIWQAALYLRQIKPAVVVSFGGYTALPVCVAAKWLKLSLLIHEQTLAGGLTNQLTARLADRVAVSFPQSRPHFPDQKTIVTGNPLRLAVIDAKRKTKKDQPTIYVTGGNQGSKVINETVSQLLFELLEKYRVYHQFGLAQTRQDWLKQKKVKTSLPKKLQANYSLQRWFSDSSLTTIFRLKPLVISRAGVNTVTELAFLGLKAVLIPLPITQKNEQTVNAHWLKSRGQAVVLPQKELTADSLNQALKKANQLVSKQTADLKFSQATDKLYQQVLKLIRRD